MGLLAGWPATGRGGIDGRLHVARGGVDVADQIELHRNRVVPNELADVISVTPAIRPNWRSSGVATAEAMVSGLAPGSCALTEIEGNRPAAAENRQQKKSDAPGESNRQRQQRSRDRTMNEGRGDSYASHLAGNGPDCRSRR